MKNFLAALIVLPVLFLGTLAFANLHIVGAPVSGGTSGVPVSGGTSGPSLSVSTQLQNPIKSKTFSDLIATLISSVVYILSPFLVLAFIYIGFLFVQAQGNETKLEEAKSAFLWTVVGAFILMSAWGFSKIIESTVKTLAQ